jgi:hypothetical protein
MHWMAAAFWSSSEVPSFFFSLPDDAVGLTESSLKPSQTIEDLVKWQDLNENTL